MSSGLIDNPLTAGAVYTIALGAIYKGTQRNLTKHIKRHQPPDEDDKDKEEDEKVDDVEKEKVEVKENGTTTPEIEAQPPAEESRPQSRWSKWKDILLITAFVVVTCGFGLFLGIGLPKIATPAITDVVWMAMVGLQIAIVYRKFINNVLPDPRTMEVSWSAWNAITWTETNATFDTPAPFTTKRRIIVGFLTIATLGGVYTGNQWMIGLPVGTLVYNYVSSTMVPDRPVRSIIKWMVIIQLALAGTFSIAFGCVTLYQAYRPSEPKADKDPGPPPSQEVLMLMMMFASSLPLCISGYFVGLGLRFDYNQSIKSGTITPPPKITDKTKIVKLPPFPKPFFKAALETLVIQLGLIAIAQCSPKVWGLQETSQMFVAFCLPANVVVGRMVLLARSMELGDEFGACTELGSKALKKKQEEQRKALEEGDDTILDMVEGKVAR